MRLKRLACFDQRLQAGKNTRPPIRGSRVGSIAFRSLIMRYGNLSGLALWNEFDRNAGGIAGSARSEGVLQELRRITLEHLAPNIGSAFAIGSEPIQFIGPPGLRFVSSSAPIKMTRLDSGETKPSQTLSGGAAK